MLIGPEIAFKDTLPVTMRPTIRSVNTEVSQVLAAACTDRGDRAVLLQREHVLDRAAGLDRLVHRRDADQADALAAAVSLADGDRHVADLSRRGAPPA